jgi:hypothetical protein
MPDDTERIDALQDELDEAIEHEHDGDTEPSEPDDPEVMRLYVELRDLDAAGTNTTLETGRKLVELSEKGQTGRDIAKRAYSMGIENCANQSTVVRLTQYARVVDLARSEYGAELAVPSEFAIRRLCVEKDPAGNEWSPEDRLEFLGNALDIAAEENVRLSGKHVRVALEKSYPPAPKPETAPVAPRVRRVTAQLERLAREFGADALARAITLYETRHAKDEPTAEEEADGAA